MPDDPGSCPHGGACAWRRNGTYPRHLIVLGRLRVQRWQCKACRGSTSPLPPDVTSRQRPQTFRELVADLYVYCVSFRGLSRLLALLGCGVGAATLWRDVQAVAATLEMHGCFETVRRELREWTCDDADRIRSWGPETDVDVAACFPELLRRVRALWTPDRDAPDTEAPLLALDPTHHRDEWGGGTVSNSLIWVAGWQGTRGPR